MKLPNEPKPAIEWDGNKLYAYRHGKRVYVGEAVKECFNERWHVYIGGFRRHTASDEASARRHLESYA